MENGELITIINKDLELQFPSATANDLLREKLAAFLNQIIQTDFQKLVFLLYRVDIDESKLKKLLHEHPDENAGLIIADLVIEREAQKIKSRKEFKNRDKESDEERW